MGEATILDGVLTEITKIAKIESIDLVGTINTVGNMPDPTPKGSEGVAFVQATAGAGAWNSMTGHSDPDSDWTDETKAYDDDTDTKAVSYERGTTPSFSGFLILTIAAKTSNKLRIQVGSETTIAVHVIDVYKDGAWVNVANETVGEDDYGTWLEYSFSQGSVTKIRIYVQHVLQNVESWIYEVDLWSVPATGGEMVVEQDSAERTLPHMAKEDLREAITLSAGLNQEVIAVAANYKVIIYGYNIVNNDSTNVGDYNLWLGSGATPLYFGCIPTETPVIKTFVHPVDGGDGEDVKINIVGSTDTDVIVFADVVAV